jgi:hypothetical protein
MRFVRRTNFKKRSQFQTIPSNPALNHREMNHIIRRIVAAALLSLIGGVANAQLVELQQNAQDKLRATNLYADTYYNGGYAGNTTTSGPLQNNAEYGPGPNLGFTFSTNAAVLQSGTGSTYGRFQNLPTDSSGDGNNQVLNFNNTYPTPITNVINFATGFTGVTFNYSLGNNYSTYDQTADVWSGLNGTGTILGTIQLGIGTLQSTQQLNSATTTITPSSSQYLFTAWSSASANNFSGSGVAQSVTFGTSTNLANEELEIDAFTVQAVPEPHSVWLMLGGLGLLAFMRRRALRA